MQHVDALSRNPVENTESNDDLFVFRIEAADWILAGQMNDTKLAAIHDILLKSSVDDYEKGIHKDYKLKNIQENNE